MHGPWKSWFSHPISRNLNLNSRYTIQNLIHGLWNPHLGTLSKPRRCPSPKKPNLRFSKRNLKPYTWPKNSTFRHPLKTTTLSSPSSGEEQQKTSFIEGGGMKGVFQFSFLNAKDDRLQDINIQFKRNNIALNVWARWFINVKFGVCEFLIPTLITTQRRVEVWCSLLDPKYAPKWPPLGREEVRPTKFTFDQVEINPLFHSSKL